MKPVLSQNTPGKAALIYCRVSDSKQRLEGHGLDSQEHRCRQYAAFQGYDVEEVFPDDVSGGGDFMKRKGMVALLAYLDANTSKDYVIVFDDLKRFARDRDFHFKLRATLAAKGASVECLNFNFEDTPEGEFIETIFAAQGQLERKQNQRQVVQKMKARIEKGYWCFAPVLGYTYANVPGHGKMIVRDEPNASIVAEALEGYACGRFQNANEVRRFLGTFPSIQKGKYGDVPLNTVVDMLDRVLYTGHISVPKWNIHLHPGKHEPPVSNP
ncbi:recombinase family protein [Kordiimonas pumila]|uniref:Recombinase family protein n=1 Tax=Kordiimonas pumila TaxID=2161677 RepID=A0ABV7D3P1_9PROT|nr:recombinase family protein [Kordiimonas pumila]